MKSLFLFPIIGAALFVFTGCPATGFVAVESGPAYYGDEVDFYYEDQYPYSRSYGPLVYRNDSYYYRRGGRLIVYDRPTYKYRGPRRNVVVERDVYPRRRYYNNDRHYDNDRYDDRYKTRSRRSAPLPVPPAPPGLPRRLF